MYEVFMEVLEKHGGKAPNKKLLEALGWSKEEYDNVRARLLEHKLIKLGRGRGGSVIKL